MSKCPIRPLSDRVLIQLEEPEGVSKGGIILPDNSKEKPSKGKVLAVGPGKLPNSTCSACKKSLNIGDEDKIAVDVKVGDTIFFLKWAGAEVPEEYGKDLKIINEVDILAVVEG